MQMYERKIEYATFLKKKMHFVIFTLQNYKK